MNYNYVNISFHRFCEMSGGEMLFFHGEFPEGKNCLNVASVMIQMRQIEIVLLCACVCLA